MWRYVARRLVLAIPTLLGASMIVFAMVHLAPGDPIAAVLPVDASKQQIEQEAPCGVCEGFEHQVVVSHGARRYVTIRSHVNGCLPAHAKPQVFSAES